MKKKVLICGSVVHDIFLSVSGIMQKDDLFLIPSGKKEPVTHLHTAIGGGGANAAVNISCLDQEVYLCAAFPDNHLGKELKRKLEEENIDLQYSESYDATESFSMIFPASGNQTVFCYAGTNDLLKLQKVDKEMLQNMDLWYVAPLHGRSRVHFFELLQDIKNDRPFVFASPSLDQIMDQDRYLFRSLSHIDALQCNHKEAKLFLHYFFDEKGGSQACSSLADRELDLFFNELHNKGVSLLIVTHGKQGVSISYKKKKYHLSMPEITVKNTVGAGDAFASTFITFFLENRDVIQSCYAAATQVLAVLESSDAQLGLLPKETVSDRISEIKLRCQVNEILVN
jgi:ribokinase